MKTKSKKQIIVPPKDGWIPNSYYLVEVAMNPNNPIFRALFFTGFLNKNGTPGSYNNVCNLEEHTEFHQVFFMRAVKHLWHETDRRSANGDKCFAYDAADIKLDPLC